MLGGETRKVTEVTFLHVYKQELCYVCLVLNTRVVLVMRLLAFYSEAHVFLLFQSEG